MTEYILGINSAYHESSACLFKNGKLVSFIEEERLNRIKHGKKFHINNIEDIPEKSIEYCLDKANITLEDVSHIGYSLDPDRRLKQSINHNFPYHIPTGNVGSTIGEAIFFLKNRRVEGILRQKGFDGQFHFIEHHLCHAMAAFFASGFPASIILVIDGIGEFSSTSAYIGEGLEIKKLFEINYPNSLGFLWEEISCFVGFDRYDAAKLMGLSSYGDASKYKRNFDELIKIEEAGLFTVNDSIIQFRSSNKKELEALFGISKNKRKIDKISKQDKEYINIAATLQKTTEDALIKICKQLKLEYDINHLCLSGGVALNCSSNGKLLNAQIFDDIYIQPTSNDAGTAIGACYYIETTQYKNKPDKLDHTFLGPSFDDKEIYEALKESTLNYSKHNNIEEVTAKLIEEGNIIAWFQGKMEAGPRALGNRSILCDPRDKRLADRINTEIKSREFFRPLCPSILEEEAVQWFELPNKIPNATKYMLMAVNTNLNKRAIIPGAVHFDGTSRIQTVSRSENPRFWKLIKYFFEKTAIPMIINTSFNIQEPIVCSPNDAIRTFSNSNIDYLVINDFLCKRK